ncbi:MAG: hypothetical protein WCW44_01700 [archaeon]|jgi:hypothetical protein
MPLKTFFNRARQLVSLRKKKSIPPITKPVGLERVLSNYPPTRQGIKQIMLKISSSLTPVLIRQPKNSVARQDLMMGVVERQRLLDGRTLARKNRIFVPGVKEGASPRGKNALTPLWGCHQECLVMYEAIIELGKRHGINFNARLVRKMHSTVRRNGTRNLRPHTELFFEIDGKTYSADPFNEKMRLVDKKELRKTKVIRPVPISYEEFVAEKAGQIPYAEENALQEFK